MKISYSIATGVWGKFVVVATLVLCVFALEGRSATPTDSGPDVARSKYEPLGGAKNLARRRQNKMRTVNLSTPEMKANFEPSQTLTLLDVEDAALPGCCMWVRLRARLDNRVEHRDTGSISNPLLFYRANRWMKLPN
jgi:hypothetical protein